MADIPLDRAIALALGLLVIAAVFVAYVWTIFWAYRDAKSRGKSGVLVALLVALLHPWPLPVPNDWTSLVNRAQTDAETEAIRRSIQRGAPLGSPQWQRRTAGRLGLEWTLRARGRPRKSNPS